MKNFFFAEQRLVGFAGGEQPTRNPEPKGSEAIDQEIASQHKELFEKLDKIKAMNPDKVDTKLWNTLTSYMRIVRRNLGRTAKERKESLGWAMGVANEILDGKKDGVDSSGKKMNMPAFKVSIPSNEVPEAEEVPEAGKEQNAESKELEALTQKLEAKIALFSANEAFFTPREIAQWENRVNVEIDKINQSIMQDALVPAMQSIESTLDALDIPLQWQQEQIINVKRNGNQSTITIPTVRGQYPINVQAVDNGCGGCIFPSADGLGWSSTFCNADLVRVTFSDNTVTQIDMTKNGKYNVPFHKGETFDTNKIKRPQPKPVVPEVQDNTETLRNNARDLFRSLVSEVESGRIEQAKSGETLKKFNDALNELGEMDKQSLIKELGISDRVTVHNEENAGSSEIFEITFEDKTDSVEMHEVIEPAAEPTREPETETPQAQNPEVPRTPDTTKNAETTSEAAALKSAMDTIQMTLMNGKGINADVTSAIQKIKDILSTKTSIAERAGVLAAIGLAEVSVDQGTNGSQQKRAEKLVVDDSTGDTYVISPAMDFDSVTVEVMEKEAVPEKKMDADDKAKEEADKEMAKATDTAIANFNYQPDNAGLAETAKTAINAELKFLQEKKGDDTSDRVKDLKAKLEEVQRVIDAIPTTVDNLPSGAGDYVPTSGERPNNAEESKDKEIEDLQKEVARLSEVIAKLTKQIEELLNPKTEKPNEKPVDQPSSPEKPVEKPKTSADINKEIADLRAERGVEEGKWNGLTSKGYDALHADGDKGFKELEGIGANIKRIDAAIVKLEAELKTIEAKEKLPDDVDALIVDRKKFSDEIPTLEPGDTEGSKRIQEGIGAIDKKLGDIRTKLNEDLSKVAPGDTVAIDAIKATIAKINVVLGAPAEEQAAPVDNADATKATELKALLPENAVSNVEVKDKKITITFSTPDTAQKVAEILSASHLDESLTTVSLSATDNLLTINDATKALNDIKSSGQLISQAIEASTLTPDQYKAVLAMIKKDSKGFVDKVSPFIKFLGPVGYIADFVQSFAKEHSGDSPQKILEAAIQKAKSTVTA